MLVVKGMDVAVIPHQGTETWETETEGMYILEVIFTTSKESNTRT